MKSKLELLFAASYLISWLFIVTSGQAMISSVSIMPAQPTSQDTIVFTVEGSFPDLCWNMDGFNFSQQSQDEYAAIVSAVDIADSFAVCPTAILEYQYSAALGTLNPGMYTVYVTELHQSIRDPWPDNAVLSFEVAVPSESADSPSDIPHDYCLAQCYPNPFNPTTTISFNLPITTQASLVVYNLAGQAVQTLVDNRLSAGSHNITFDGARLSSGVYFYTLNAGAYSETKKMLLVK